MISRIPSARRVETQRLLSVVAIPFAAALAMGTAVLASGTAGLPTAEGGGVVAFLLEFVKFCYLAVGMAHLSGALAERFTGGLPAGLWLDELGEERTPATAQSFWDTFPNHVDGSAIALGVAVLCWSLG